MKEPSSTNKFNGARLNDRQVSEVIGISRGLLADGQLNDAEVEYLYKWLAASQGVTENSLVGTIFDRLSEILSDDIIDDDERAELISTLTQLTANDFEVGELLKATTLPLCKPAPDLYFEGARYTFTGTFTFGNRRACEGAVRSLGAVTGSLARKTDFLVIGEYATDSWQHSSFGRKIEKGVEYRDQGHPIAIVSEAHWKSYLPR